MTNKLYETLQDLYEAPVGVALEPSEFYPLTIESELILSFWYRIKLAFWLITGKHLHTLTEAEINNIGYRHASSVVAPPEYFYDDEED